MSEVYEHWPNVGMRWYRACRVLVLVAAIAVALSAGGNVMSALAGRVFRLSGSTAELFAAFQRLWIPSAVTQLFFMALLFATYRALRHNNRRCLYLIHTYTVIIPAAFLLLIPVQRHFFAANLALMTEIAQETGSAALFQARAQATADTILFVSISGAVITLALLLLNSLYFHRRRHLLGTGQRID